MASGSADPFNECRACDPALSTAGYSDRPNGALCADDGAACDEFGYSVAISGVTAIVGARMDDDNGSRSGSAYLFDAARRGDLNCDGDVNAFDIEPFLNLLFP